MGNDLELKPVIRELVRTRVCFPDILLLVDKVTVVDLTDLKPYTNSGAYRLYLTDGEVIIQALLKRRLHKYVTREDVYEGSYVVLKEYSLASAKRLNGDGNVRYLAISDFYSIGDASRNRDKNRLRGDE
ncbi:hypothetical protein JMJ35_008728 [Cladonia borealis]|uniref:Uncharacterized protein n=1 Tax=Cladonia borealis TaxID=184061 RepID=A0AA39UYF2_9LECA|nr:hypothetical protein JMJ35_008728 [Cladonia borealis]